MSFLIPIVKPHIELTVGDRGGEARFSTGNRAVMRVQPVTVLANVVGANRVGSVAEKIEADARLTVEATVHAQVKRVAVDITEEGVVEVLVRLLIAVETVCPWASVETAARISICWYVWMEGLSKFLHLFNQWPRDR